MQNATTPRLLKSFQNHRTQKSIEVWFTNCIVTNFGKNQLLTKCSILVNPANPELTGVSKFPYFPKGGPVPERNDDRKSNQLGWESSVNWGGLDVGSNMVYPASVVDGIVHQLGGTKLGEECKRIRQLHGGCPTGMSVATIQGEEALLKCYDQIIHTTPPFYKSNDQRSNDLLRECYHSSLQLAFRYDHVKVACPLIGAGARGFPLEEALIVAATESTAWIKKSDHDEVGKECKRPPDRVLMFGIPDLDVGKNLVSFIESIDIH